LKLARKITHQNVGKMFDINEDQGTHYITMEYVSGQDLKGLIRQTGQLAIGTSISIAKQICEGLAEAHKLGIVHRDLKPNNIMIDREGQVRILDFGIARSLKEKGITGAGVMIGTPEYMSPEQAEAKQVDQRSDIYSFGVILFEMLTGRVPFEGGTAISIAMKHKGEIPRNPKEYNAQIPDDLSHFVLKCLKKDKDKRYQSAAEAKSELEDIETGIPKTDRVIPQIKPITSKVTMTISTARRLLIPALAVFAVMIVGLFLWHPWMGTTKPQEHRSAPSIAVLPFEDLSLNRDQEYLCNGLADELISRLVNVEGLRVPARTSVFSIKGKELDIREIGEKLDVELVLEGSLKKSGDILRITVQLVDVSDGFSLWSENYERNEEDIFRLQDDISLAIVDKLQIQLLGKEQEKLTKRPTENLEAYNLYLQGRFFLEKRTAEALWKAVDFFQSAIEKDPGYSLAYIGLADTYQMLHGYGVSSTGDVFPKAKNAILKALEIDENLSEAHTSLGWIKFFFEWDWPGAETAFVRALELNPDSAQGHHWLGWYLGAMGRYEEALSAFERSRKLDPLSLIINSASIWCFSISGQTDRATEQYHKTVELDENYPRAHFWYGLTLLQMKEIEKALEQFESAVEISGGNPQYLSVLAYAYALAERKEEAEKLLARLHRLYRESYVSPVQMAWVYIGLNDKDRALDWLEQAYEESAGWLCLIKVEQIYSPLRTDPRFQALLKKMNLE